MATGTLPADVGVSITDTDTDHSPSRGVWIGTSQDLDFYFEKTSSWVTFQACAAGTWLPIEVTGARKNAGSAACDAGDVVFLN